MKTVFHARPCCWIIEIQSNLRRKKLHRMDQVSYFLKEVVTAIRNSYRIWIWVMQSIDQVHRYKNCPNCPWIWVMQGIDQVHRYKNCPNCPTKVGGKENIWLLDTLKHSILELILSKKTLTGIKTVFFKI